MPVTSYLLASCPGYFPNFHLASVAPEVETSWESEPQESLTFAPCAHDSRAARILSGSVAIGGGNLPLLDLQELRKMAMDYSKQYISPNRKLGLY